MYSPKIREDLVPLLYRIRKWHRKPMTAVIDDILRPRVEQMHTQVIKEQRAFYFGDEEDYDEPRST